MKNIITAIGIGLVVLGTQAVAVNVKITEELSSIVAKDKGMEITIERIQNPKNALNGLFSNSSKECPPYCIQPMSIESVETVGELKVLKFIEEMKSSNSHLLLDARTKKWYEKGTIPSSTNLPFMMLNKDGVYIDNLLTLLGGEKIDQKWNFNKAPTLLIFSNGAWDEQGILAIKNLIAVGYPQDKILYYRGGLHMWNSVGLTIKK